VKVLGKGVYSIAEAARLTRLPAARVRAWFRGRESSGPNGKGEFQSDYPILEGEYAISFLDLIELFIVGRLQEAGISLPLIRRSYHALKVPLGRHPFCHRHLREIGVEFFTHGLNEKDAEVVRSALTRQRHFGKVIQPFLRQLDYDETTGMAARWHIADLVTVDPAFRFGRPIVDETGITTSVLQRAFYANGEDAAFVASWFGVQEEHVEAAVRFEDNLAA
jgi:uncharacterized protein (DUF433 family)